MARDLLQSDRNELTIKDGISGGDVVLYYRLPTTEERIAFQKGCFKEKNGKLINQTVAARAAYGKHILTGLRDGDFVAGKQPISSDPASPDFRTDWKELASATAGDLLIMLGMHVFEGTIQNLLQQTLADKPAPAAEGGEGDEEANAAGLPKIVDVEAGEPIGPLAQS